MEKESVKERIKFLDIAKGSAAEFMTQAYIGMDIEYIDKEKGIGWIDQIEHILSMLTKLQQNLETRLSNA